MILLQVVAQMRRDVRLGQGSKLRLNPKVCFLLEQPAEPPQEPTCASFWRTGEWKALKTILGLDLLTFNQGDFGGLAAKPTSLALNFPFQTPQRRLEEPVDLRPRAEVTSKDLARWAPGMMREVATQVVKHIQKRRVTLQVLSWREHLAQGHIPFRRDCGVCQRAAARQRPHRAQGIPEPCVLALDLSGPFAKGKDIDGDEKKYFLVGSYTWPVYEGHEWEKDEVCEGKPGWPVLEEEEAEGIPPLEPIREPWQDEYPDMEDYYPQSEAEGPGS